MRRGFGLPFLHCSFNLKQTPPPRVAICLIGGFRYTDGIHLGFQHQAKEHPPGCSQLGKIAHVCEGEKSSYVPWSQTSWGPCMPLGTCQGLFLNTVLTLSRCSENGAKVEDIGLQSSTSTYHFNPGERRGGRDCTWNNAKQHVLSNTVSPEIQKQKLHGR